MIETTINLDLNVHSKRIELINNGSLDDLIEFAKSYNIFQTSNSRIYTEVCNEIKARLDKEGLSHDTVRPE
jgi:hypothetical protein